MDPDTDAALSSLAIAVDREHWPDEVSDIDQDSLETFTDGHDFSEYDTEGGLAE